jgi:hypothetical protein
MTRRNWKRAQPSSLRQALEWSIDHARERHNLSVERIAERMGLESHWTLYKWVQTGRIPAVFIPAYEHVCGISLVSRWLAATTGKVLIDMPTGRSCTSQELQELQGVLHTAVGALFAFYDGTTDDIQQTLSAIQSGLESLAWHRGNVQQHQTPQLELGETDDE